MEQNEQVAIDDLVISSIPYFYSYRGGIPFLGALGAPPPLCDPPTRRADSTLSDIDLVSDADINSDYPAGTSLRDVARFRVETDVEISPYGVLEHRYDLEDPERTPTLAQYLERGTPLAPLRALVILDVPTDAIRRHQFTLSYSISGTSTTYAAITEPAVLTPASLEP